MINARGHNLKNVTAEIPLGLFTCVTGVSGGGKSTLLVDTLYKAIARKLNNASEAPAPHDKIEGLEHLDKIIDIDQSPIGRTPRSNPATYTGAFTPIREWFAGLPESKARGYEPGRFSFNVKGGRCEACEGDGVIKIEMHFLPDVYVTCDTCKGKRYNRETLEVTFKQKSIADILDMTVDEAADFFKAVPRIRDILTTLQRVGLGYIHVGQQATTLSGGEAQRVKLAKELSKRATGRTLYILDEPTTGLHFHDVAKLLDVLHELVASGNSVVVIEHNLEVIKTADWIIDLGPEGGDGGGEIVAAGPPEDDRAREAQLYRRVPQAGAGAARCWREEEADRGGGVSGVSSRALHWEGAMTKLPHRRDFLHLAAGAAALPAATRFTWAQAYPARPVRLIDGYPPGGSADIIARLIGQWLSERLGQPFVIDNRRAAVATSPPSGRECTAGRPYASSGRHITHGQCDAL